VGKEAWWWLRFKVGDVAGLRVSPFRKHKKIKIDLGRVQTRSLDSAAHYVVNQLFYLRLKEKIKKMYRKKHGRRETYTHATLDVNAVGRKWPPCYWGGK
jgi:hypothetical protein